MTLKACSKCLRINTGSGWTPNPSSQLDRKRKDVDWSDGCPLCADQPQEPANGAQRIQPDAAGDAGALPEAPAQGGQGSEKSEGRKLAPAGDRPEAQGASGDGTPAGRPRRGGRLEREAERREAKAKRGPDCAANLAERPQPVKPLMPGADMDEKLGAVAHEHHQALIACRKMMGRALIEFATHLKAIRDQELWRFYDVESWKEYLAMSDVDIDDSRSRRLIQLVETKEKLEKQLGHPVDIEGIPEYRLTRGLLPCIEVDKETGEIKNVEVAEELIAQARTLGCNDWAAEVEERKSTGGGGGPRAIPELILQANTNLLNENGEVVGVVVTARADENNHTLKIKIGNGYITDDLVIRFQ